jgi:hypothetical protein
MNRADPHVLDSRDRLLLVHAQMLRLSGKVRAARRDVTSNPADVWDAIGHLAAAIETLTRVQLEKTP